MATRYRLRERKDTSVRRASAAGDSGHQAPLVRPNAGLEAYESLLEFKAECKAWMGLHGSALDAVAGQSTEQERHWLACI